jgi:hypothetical protein
MDRRSLRPRLDAELIMPPTKALEAPSTAVEAELAKLEDELGGRHELVGLLVLAPSSPELKYILGQLGDPRNARKTLARICADGNIYPGEVIQHLTAASLLRGRVKAAQHIGNGISAVALDVMTRAAPYFEPCRPCRGTGAITNEPSETVPNPSPSPCTACSGMGSLRREPDLERQKLAVDLAGLLPKSGHLQILNQQLAVTGTTANTFERIQALTDKILHNSGPIMPPEILDADVTTTDERSEDA